MIGTILTAWDIGNNQVLGRIRNIITFPMQVATLLGVYGIFFELPIILIAGIVITITIIGIGYGYMKTGLLKKELKVKYNHSPQIEEILKIVRRLDENKKT